MSKAKDNDADKPAAALIDQFDEAIQKRFFVDPDFGVRRIMSVGEVSHPNEVKQEKFYPRSDELRSLYRFEQTGWNVGLYLYGRRATENIIVKKGKEKKELSVKYFTNPALPVTQKLDRTQLTGSEKLLKKVEAAFNAFANQNTYEFQKDNWFYVARPVRAKESCLECHTDFTITGKSGDKKYVYRTRQAGDTIGVLVYAFTKAKDAAGKK